MPTVQSKRVNVRLPPETVAQVDWLARRQVRTKTSVICFAIDRMWQAEQAQMARGTAQAAFTRVKER